MKKIIVSDVTLKVVEEQDLLLTFREKLAIAEKLDALLVDAIELPVITASKENEVIYSTIASTVKNAIVKIPVVDGCNLKVVADCLKKANKGGLQVVMPVSTAQMEYFHHMKAPVMKAKIEELCNSALEICGCVEFVAKDAFRAEPDFVVELAKSVSALGVKSITVCDDAGEAFPEDYAKLVKQIKDACDIKVFVQPSNALSLAVACALKAIEVGADGVKTSVYGDYLALDVLADVFRAKKFTLDADCGVDVTNAKSVSSIINGVAVDAQDQDDDNKTSSSLNSNSTVKEVSCVVKQLGYELSDEDIGKVYDEFKKLTATKEVIDEKELEAVIASTAMQVPSTYHLVNYVVNSGNIIPATANVTLEKDGGKFTGVSTGDGPIDAAFHAIEQVIGHHYELDDFQVHAVTKGRGAVGSSIIRLRADGKLYPGNGVSTDIVGACIRAYINALNKIVYEEN